MEALAACALCDSLGSSEGNFVPNTEEAKKNHARIHFLQSKCLNDEIEESEIFQRCFTTCQLKIERPSSKHECRRSLLDLCKSFLLNDHSKSAAAVCNLCGTGISKIKENMFHHACAHLDVKLFKCHLCGCRLASSYGTIRRHMKRVHHKEPSRDDFEDKTDEYFDEISIQIKRCFSPKYPLASVRHRQFIVMNESRSKSHRSVVHLCRSIFLQRTQPTSLECNLCGSQINLRRRHCPERYFRADLMYDHAALHLPVKLFTCRHCRHPLSTKEAVKAHLRNSHQIVDRTSEDFDDRSEEFHSQYLNMIERCFSGEQLKLEDPCINDMDGVKANATGGSRANRSKLAIKRHLFYKQLIKNNNDSDGKIICSLCSKRILVKLPGGKVSRCAFFHAEMHLQKPLYRCKVCGIRVNTHPAVCCHLRKKHALGTAKNHECIADEHHEEIMAILSKCYDVSCKKSLQ